MLQADKLEKKKKPPVHAPVHAQPGTRTGTRTAIGSVQCFVWIFNFHIRRAIFHWLRGTAFLIGRSRDGTPVLA